MKKHLLVFATTTVLTIAACAKKEASTATAEATDTQVATYETYCPQPHAPTGATGASGTSGADMVIPDALPVVRTTVDVQSCPGLPDNKPSFFAKEMPGLVAIVDCNAKLVRFRTRDWQTNEASTIGPMGEFDVRVMYITRFAADYEGNQNCWARLLGRVKGHATCVSESPNSGRISYQIDWHFDETPASVMEPANPGVADLRNGTQCRVGPGNCNFSNLVPERGCGG